LHLDIEKRPSRQRTIRRVEKVVLTGATGYLGTAVAREVVREGYYVRALVRPVSHTKRLEELGVELIYGDIRDRERVTEAANGMDIAIHMAAALQGSRDYILDCAIKGTENIASAAQRCDLKRVIYVSSMSVYDALALYRGKSIAEDAPLEEFPLLRGSYSLAKRMAEDVVLPHLQDRRPSWTILRPSLIVGKDRNELSSVGKKIGNLLICPGSSKTRLELVYVDDVAAAVTKLLQCDQTRGRIFNISGPAITKEAYIHQVVSGARYEKARIIYIPYWPARLALSILAVLRRLIRVLPQIHPRQVASLCQNAAIDCSAIKAAIGWQPRKNMI
jgi:dihydroflavonol-4-reductase